MAELSSAGGRPRPTGGLELYAWLFMRVSGIALLLLALGHLAIMHLINSRAVQRAVAFLAGKFLIGFFKPDSQLPRFVGLSAIIGNPINEK